jgi:hypothetical protein
MAVCFTLAYMGSRLGERWSTDPTLRGLFHKFDAVISIVLLAGVGWFVWSRWRAGAVQPRDD